MRTDVSLVLARPFPHVGIRESCCGLCMQESRLPSCLKGNKEPLGQMENQFLFWRGLETPLIASFKIGP